MMNTLDLQSCWRSFRCLASDAEAAAYSECCIFSLATLEIACQPGATTFALTERKEPEVWRWAVVDALGRVVDDGWEPCQAGAKQAAAQALQAALAQSTMCHHEPAMR